MKRLIAILLVICIVMILAACGSNGGGKKETNAPVSQQPQKIEQNEKPSDNNQSEGSEQINTNPIETEPVETEPVETEPVETEPVETEPVETEPAETEPAETEPVETEPVETEPVETEPAETEPVDTEPVETEPVETELTQLEFEEIVAIDNAECMIKITGIENDSFWGYTLKVYLENKSAEKTYMFTITKGAVNGVEWDPLLAETVAPGKKANSKAYFVNEEKEALLPVFTDIELEFRVYDSNDWMADDVALETVHVYPLGEDKATAFIREPQETDTVIVDNDQITILVTGYPEDSFWGYVASVYLVNKTEKTLMFTVDDASVNGFMCEPFWACTVAPGKQAFESISWTESSLEENNITEIETIEMTFRVYDSDNIFDDDIYNESVTLTP